MTRAKWRLQLESGVLYPGWCWLCWHHAVVSDSGSCRVRWWFAFTQRCDPQRCGSMSVFRDKLWTICIRELAVLLLHISAGSYTLILLFALVTNETDRELQHDDAVRKWFIELLVCHHLIDNWLSFQTWNWILWWKQAYICPYCVLISRLTANTHSYARTRPEHWMCSIFLVSKVWLSKDVGPP